MKFRVSVLLVVSLTILPMFSYSREKVKPAEDTIVYVQQNKKVEPVKEQELSIYPVIEKASYAEDTIVKIEQMTKIDSMESMTNIISVIQAIDVAKMSSVNLIKIMEVVTQVFNRYNADRIEMISKSAKQKYLEWYDMDKAVQCSTGLWAVMTKAKYFADRGEDVSNLYRLFLKMLTQYEIDLNTHKIKE